MNKPVLLKLSITSKQIHILRAVLLITSLATIFYSCNNEALPTTPTTLQEQLSFTAQDTADIITLAKTVYPGEIENIIISTARSMFNGKGKIEVMASIKSPPLLSNYVYVTFKPEHISDKIKRYRSIFVSNITWEESEYLLTVNSKIIRNNWITSSNRLSSYDKTILTLDSCTIEAVVTNADIDTVEHLLNLISASCYSIDSLNVDMEAIDVRKVTKVERLADSETYNVLLLSRGISYYILYKDGKVVLISDNYYLVQRQL